MMISLSFDREWSGFWIFRGEMVTNISLGFLAVTLWHLPQPEVNAIIIRSFTRREIAMARLAIETRLKEYGSGMTLEQKRPWYELYATMGKILRED